MASIGFNFSGGSGGTSETNIAVGNDFYPTTQSGVTYGWSGGINERPNRNRNASDRFSGMQWSHALRDFRVDITGEWNLKSAIKDDSNGRSQFNNDYTVLDGPAEIYFSNVDGRTTEIGDLAGDLHLSEADWDANAFVLSHNYTDHLIFRLNQNVINEISHLELTQAAIQSATNVFRNPVFDNPTFRGSTLR